MCSIPARQGPRRAGARAGISLVLGALVIALAGAAGAASLPNGAVDARKKPAVRAGGTRTGKAAPIVLFHINHRETMRLRFADDRGRPVKGVQQQINHFLRCHKTKKRHAINPRLTRLIYETGKHFAGRRIEVISGYRHPRVAKNPRSPHMKGLACDMRVQGVKNTELRDFFRQRFKSVGVGYYPNSSFVHLDVRRGASAFWIDYSGPGENALYADNALEDLRSGRADRWRRTIIDPSWADEDESELDGNDPNAGDDGAVEPDSD